MSRLPKTDNDSVTAKFITQLISDATEQLALAYGVSGDPHEFASRSEEEFGEHAERSSKKAFLEARGVALKVSMGLYPDDDVALSVEDKQQFVGKYLHQIHSRCVEILKEFQ